MRRIFLFCFLIGIAQKSSCQVIANANGPYYANAMANTGMGIPTGMPAVNTLAVNTPATNIVGGPMLSNGIPMVNTLSNGQIYTAIPGEPAINTIAATNIAAAAANAALGAGVTALDGFSLGGLPMSAVSPMGYGDVAVIGELPVGGSTAVAGNVPVIGYVTFEGTVPAGGTVTLASNCGCNNPTVF